MLSEGAGRIVLVSTLVFTNQKIGLLTALASHIQENSLMSVVIDLQKGAKRVGECFLFFSALIAH
jgi:hypothetical protein